MNQIVRTFTLDRRFGDPVQKLIAVTLADMTEIPGADIEISLNALAIRCEVSGTTISERLGNLIERELVTRVPRRRQGDPYCYRLNIDALHRLPRV